MAAFDISRYTQYAYQDYFSGTYTIIVDPLTTITITSGTMYNLVPNEPKKIESPKNKPFYRNLNPRKKQW